MTTTRTVPEIRASEVIDALQNGVTRFKADDEGYGSIEEKYGLSPAGVRRLFKNETLKGLKTIMPEFTFVNDVTAEEEEVLEDDLNPYDAASYIEEIPEEVHEAQVASLFTGIRAEELKYDGEVTTSGVPNDGVEDLFK